MNQRTVSRWRTGSVSFWAWTASIALHLVVLAVFGIVKFAHGDARAEQAPRPIAKVSRVRKLIRAAPTIPKPKVKRAVKSRSAKSAGRLLPAGRILDTPKAAPQDLLNLVKPSALQSVFSAAPGSISPHSTEFFGSTTDQRKICYLVDCSGSMHGVFGRVREKLAESIQTLQPDQYFYIIFFGGDTLFEPGDGRLVRATEQAKSAACDFIESVRPAGQTNAMAALQRAVQVRDGRGPSIIYFLTDGFELTTRDTRSFPQEIADLLSRFAPTTKINTIGFGTQTDDRKMLEIIARQSGGRFILIAD